MAEDQQDSTTDTADVTVEVEQPAPATGDEQLGDAGKQALDRMKRERNEHASRAKALERELAKFKQASMSEAERAVAEAREAGRAEALASTGKRLARAEFRAAASSAGIDVAPLLEDIDASRYVGDDGEPDTKAINAAVARFAAIVQPQRPKGDIAQGARNGTGAANMNDFIRAQLGQK